MAFDSRRHGLQVAILAGAGTAVGLGLFCLVKEWLSERDEIDS